MSEIRKANVEGATYFVTCTVHGWVDVFTRKELATSRASVLRSCVCASMQIEDGTSEGRSRQ